MHKSCLPDLPCVGEAVLQLIAERSEGMFHLVSKEGNVHRLVNSKAKAEALAAKGYTYVKEPKEPKASKEGKK